MRNKANKCIYRYVNLLYYKQCSLVHVVASYCGHLQGGVLHRICYTELQNSLQVKMFNLSKRFKIYVKI